MRLAVRIVGIGLIGVAVPLGMVGLLLVFASSGGDGGPAAVGGAATVAALFAGLIGVVCYRATKPASAR